MTYTEIRFIDPLPDSEAYAIFVGSITPEEFVSPYNGNVDSAIQELFEHNKELFEGCKDKKPPYWLSKALERYLNNYFEANRDG